MSETEASRIRSVKSRRYECFMEDHDEKTWTAGRCAGYIGRGSLSTHLFRCKRKSGHGLGGLYCKQHAAIEGDPV